MNPHAQSGMTPVLQLVYEMNKYLIALVIVAVAIGLWVYFSRPVYGNLDGFAKCLGPKGATFYGAFWCSHCKDQKDLFGTSAKYLPYVECSPPDGNGQLEVCNAAGIRGYPTWIFSDGTRIGGAQSLDYLASKTGCTVG